MEKEKEIRTILSSRVAFHNGAYMAASGLLKMNFVGLDDGSKAAMIFGVTSRSRRYVSESEDAAFYSAEKIFAKLGRPVYFQSDPEQSACLMRMVVGNPVIMTLDEERGGVLLSIYTARSLTSLLTIKRAFRSFERHLPEEVRLNFKASDLPREPRETLRERLEKRKVEKLKKKAVRAYTKARAAVDAQKNEGKE